MATPSRAKRKKFRGASGMRSDIKPPVFRSTSGPGSWRKSIRSGLREPRIFSTSRRYGLQNDQDRESLPAGARLPGEVRVEGSVQARGAASARPQGQVDGVSQWGLPAIDGVRG